MAGLGRNIPESISRSFTVGSLFRLAAQDIITAEWLRKHIHNASCPDQDAYNSIFRGSIKIIDSRFNVISGTNPGGITENSVLHFAGAVKPWEISGHPSQTLYWKYYTHSAWGENSSREELIDAISARAKISAPEYRLFSRNIRKIFNVLPEAISSAKLVLRDIFYRLKYRLTRR
ncbi:MAG: hypothetical protein IKQ95_05760 [Synergistaceae bacterium]|nr:hypothetical protein [Synergistaceae bacterium]